MTSSQRSREQAVKGTGGCLFSPRLKFGRVGSFRSDAANLINMFLVFVSPDDSGSRGGAGAADGGPDGAPELAGKLGNHCLNLFRSTVARRRLREGEGPHSLINKHTTGWLLVKTASDRVETRLFARGVIWWDSFLHTRPPFSLPCSLTRPHSLPSSVFPYLCDMRDPFASAIRSAEDALTLNVPRKVEPGSVSSAETLTFGVARGLYQTTRDHLSRVIKSQVPV